MEIQTNPTKAVNKGGAGPSVIHRKRACTLAQSRSTKAVNKGGAWKNNPCKHLFAKLVGGELIEPFFKGEASQISHLQAPFCLNNRFKHLFEELPRCPFLASLSTEERKRVVRCLEELILLKRGISEVAKT